MNILNINNDYLYQVFDSYIDTSQGHAGLKRIFANVDYFYYLLIDSDCMDRYQSLNTVYKEGKIQDADYSWGISLFSNTNVAISDIYLVYVGDIGLAYVDDIPTASIDNIDYRCSIEDYVYYVIQESIPAQFLTRRDESVEYAICNYTKMVLKEIELAIFKQITSKQVANAKDLISYIAIEKNEISTRLVIYIP